MTELLTTITSSDKPVRGVLRRRKKAKVLTLIAGAWLLIVVVGCAFASILAPYGSMEQDLLHSLQGPSSAHWLGTDTLGRDLLSRLMYGGRPTLVAVAIAIAVYIVLGSVLGLLAGYMGGWTDRVISGFANIVLATPHIVILFVVLSIYRGNVYLAMFVFGFLAAPVMILIVRSSALASRHELFVDAARVSGLSPLYIIFQHILPRSVGLIIVQGTVFGANAIVLESALSFLGFGTQAPAPSWGNMVAEAATQISVNAWMLYPTGGMIALTALALGVVGDSLRDRVTGGWTQPKLTQNDRQRPTEVTDHILSTSSMEAPLLSVQGLDVGYREGDKVISIVKDISFTVGLGETVGIVGESGSGKTTVAFGILGVVGDNVAITGGSVWFDGTNLLNLTGQQLGKYRGKRIAYVAQEPMVALDPNFRVGKQLLEAVSLNGGLSGAAAQERVLELLGLVELPNPAITANSYPHELSGGMAQRVSIAFALAGKPELLVADEPTTALDVTVQAEILGLLMRLREETGMSVIIITHDWGVVADICDRVVVMYQGEIVEENTVDGIYRTPKHEYTKALLASNPHGAKYGQDLPVIVGPFSTPSKEREAELNSALGDRPKVGEK